MARIVALDDVDQKLRAFLLGKLRPADEAIVLPQAGVSPESGVCNNTVMKLCGDEGGLNADVFDSNWYAGVSVVHLDASKTEKLLASVDRRALIDKLKRAIASEMADSNAKVGPELDGDANDRDVDAWEAGLDGPSCCVGVYSSVESRPPDPAKRGMNRAHTEHYLICKAGGGIAAQTFHARLVAALKQGVTLDEALGEKGSPGARALRRVQSAAKRNRARLLVQAAEVLGLRDLVDTVGDTSAPPSSQHRLAICDIDCCINGISRMDAESQGRSGWLYTSGCVDSASSVGTVASSNLADGFLALCGDRELRFAVRNDAFGSIPFSSLRVKSNREVIQECVEVRAARKQPTSHVDHEWVSTHFGWNSKDFGIDMEPPALCGTHEPEAFFSAWGRELGLSKAVPVRMRPEVVCVSACEPGRLRVAAKALSAK